MQQAMHSALAARHSCETFANPHSCGMETAVGIDKLRAIACFVRTVEAGSFAGAARQSDTSPSALSKAVGALEGDIGFTLFNRSTRKLVLTEDGKAYADCCRELLDRLEDTELG